MASSPDDPKFQVHCDCGQAHSIDFREAAGFVFVPSRHESGMLRLDVFVWSGSDAPKKLTQVAAELLPAFKAFLASSGEIVKDPHKKPHLEVIQ